MAKAFDLVHKVSDSDQPNEGDRASGDSAGTPNEDSSTPKKRTRVEIIFFYLLLFAIFFIMGVMFLAPSLFKTGGGKTTIAQSQPPTGETPIPGFTIDKPGQSTEEATKALGLASPTLTPAVSPTPTSVTSEAKTEITSGPAKIQVLNGTGQTGAAAAMQTKLAQKGIIVASIGNYRKRTVAKTTVYYTADYKQSAQQVLAVTGGIMVETSSATTGDNNILVVIGKTH